MDWKAWHDAYDDPESALTQRLVIVQQEIRAALDSLPDRPWQVISLCAGDGRDLLGALSTHPRRGDVHGLLVELDPDIAESGRDAYARAGLSNIEVRNADAAEAAHYQGLAADLLLVCGVLGNLTDEGVFELIEHLPGLCAANATLIWTRHRRAPDLTPRIRETLTKLGFIEMSFHTLEGSWGSVGAARWTDGGSPPKPPDRLFHFVPDNSQDWQEQPAAAKE
ncbi:MAG: class I SAM-dependent methyltransferase [Pseudonocardiaceae bacterium]